jgi:hypothetical protein
MTRDQILLQAANMPLFSCMPLNQVQITGKPFAELKTRFADVPRMLASYAEITPKACEPVTVRGAGAADIAAFGAGNVTVADNIASVTFGPGAFNGLQTKYLPILGWLVSIKYTANAVAATFELWVRYFASTGPGVLFTDLNNDPIITPTGGANSAAEFIVWAVQPSSTFPYDTATSLYGAAAVQRQGFLHGIPFGYVSSATNQALGLVQSAALIFKNQAAISQQATVTPILATADSEALVLDVLARNLAAGQDGSHIAGNRP